METLSISNVEQQDWDVIVIGAGMGGGLLGRDLAERGLSVLFVEKGFAGHMSERTLNLGPIRSPHARHLRGYWPKPAEARLSGNPSRFFAPYGSGVGGSSVFYAAALERPERHDIDDDSSLPHPTGGWPVDFDTFRPYFDKATALLHLCGTADPLSDEPAAALAAPPPLSKADTALMQDMESLGLHPYRLHLAIRDPQNCRMCFGSKCPWGCKMDGRSAGVIPALATGRAGLLTNCTVEEIIEDGSEVTGLRVVKEGTSTVLRARHYALCAGSMGSPQLLLSSTSRAPEGAANSSGWVGRGLMFHIDELFVIWPRRRDKVLPEFGKSISLRDLYSKDGDRYGTIQSVGQGIDYGNIVYYLNRLYDQSFLRRIPRLRAFLRIPAIIANRLLGRAAIFTGMMEDYAYPENRVVLNEEDPEIPTFEYTFNKELLARRKRFRRRLMRLFRGHWRFLISLRPVLNFGHPIGTLRFGTDPATSVLRPDCRTHDLSNLYVADASFMPSALGVNPSLTIAANALRVADVIVQKHLQEKETADVTAQ